MPCVNSYIINKNLIVRLIQYPPGYEGNPYTDIRACMPDDIAGFDRVILDFENVNYVDSKAIGAFIMFFREMRDKGKRFLFINVNENLEHIFHIIHLHRHFDICTKEQTKEFLKIIRDRVVV